MLENIIAKNFPQESGVYLFINENDEIIYVGSSKNIYCRMRGHKSCIRKGSHDGKKQDMYIFLQENQFEVQFQLTEKYADLEKQLMEKHKPIFNERYTPFSEEAKKQRLKSDKYKRRQKKYVNKLCNYNGEIIKLNTLAIRFYRAGIAHCWSEAGKYLI